MKRLFDHSVTKLEAILVFLAGGAVIASMLVQLNDSTATPIANTLAQISTGEQCMGEDSISEADEEVYFVSCGGFF